MSPFYFRDVFLIFLVVFSVNCDIQISQNHIRSQVMSLLEKWRVGNMVSDIIPLPSLKSIKIPDVDYSYDRKGIKMTYNLQKMELTGLDTFSITELIVVRAQGSLEMSISLNIPKLTLKAENYALQGRAYLLYPLKGSGNMTVIFRGSDLRLKIHFLTAATELSTRIKDFRFDFNIQEIQANLVDSSWPINNVLNSEGVEILASYHDDIVQAMWDYVVPYMENHLKDITTEQIVYTLLNTTF